MPSNDLYATIFTTDNPKKKGDKCACVCLHVYLFFYNFIIRFSQLLKEFAESERLEQLTAEKRRLKVLEYRRTVNDMLEERRRHREEELQQLQHMHELEMEEEKARYLNQAFQNVMYLFQYKMAFCLSISL